MDRRLRLPLAVMLSFVALLVLGASPAFASTLRVSAAARTLTSGGVATKSIITARATSAGTARVVIYRSGKAIRTLKMKRSGRNYSVAWNLKTAGGSRVAPGSFSLRVTARAHGRRAVARSTVRVPVPIIGLTSLGGSGRWIGVYQPNAPADMSVVRSLQSQINHHLALINFFVADSEGFPTARCQNALASGSTPMITLEMWSTKNGGLSAITNGSEDAYLRSFAASARSLGRTVWLRPLHEMNGSWYPWGATSANSPAQFIAAWRHIHDIFVAQGATNVRFVWCPNVDFAVAPYYPGDAYVDYAAIDGYNNGAPWRSFGDIFGRTYSAVVSVANKPVFVAETASTEVGGSKAAWIADMFRVIPAQFPRIEGVCWFDANKEQDWRIDSSAQSLSAFAAAVRSGF